MMKKIAAILVSLVVLVSMMTCMCLNASAEGDALVLLTDFEDGHLIEYDWSSKGKYFAPLSPDQNKADVFADNWGSSLDLSLVTDHAASGQALKVIPSSSESYAAPLMVKLPSVYRNLEDVKYIRFHVCAEDPDNVLKGEDANLSWGLFDTQGVLWKAEQSNKYYYADSEAELDAGGTAAEAVGDGQVALQLGKELWIDLPIDGFTKSVNEVGVLDKDLSNVEKIECDIFTPRQTGVTFYFDDIKLIKAEKTGGAGGESADSTASIGSTGSPATGDAAPVAAMAVLLTGSAAAAFFAMKRKVRS